MDDKKSDKSNNLSKLALTTAILNLISVILGIIKEILK